MTRFEAEVLRSIPNDYPIPASRVLGLHAPYSMEAFAAIKRLEAEGLVVKTWNTHGTTYLQRTVI